jgi:hypothetical protein
MANEVKIVDLAAAWKKLGLRLTDRRYRQLAKSGHVPDPNRGTVDAIQCLIKIAIYYQNMAENKGDATHEEEKKRKTRAEAGIKELQERKLREELIEKAEVVDELVRRTHVIKADLLALSKRLVKWPEAKSIVEKQIKHILSVYSQKKGIFRG